MDKNNIYLASKPRYEILDGLRGVAAVLVVAYHLLETYYHGGPDQPINHGYLAVDFFLCFLVSSSAMRMTTAGARCQSGTSSSAVWCVCTRWSFSALSLVPHCSTSVTVLTSPWLKMPRLGS